MFIFNMKLKMPNVLKTIITVAIVIVLSLLLFALYTTFKSLFSSPNYINDEINSNNIVQIDPDNYSNVLKEVHEDLNTYIGQKIAFTGYVYRVSDLQNNQFILARDMKINNKIQTVVIGFLCEYENATELKDSTWISIEGEITKGYYYSDIPCIKITKLTSCDPPSSPIVKAPDETYIPTAVIF